MKRPTVEECWTIVRERAVQVATAIMVRRGMTFHAAKNAAEATRLFTGDFARLVSEKDLLTAGAVLMQAYDYFEEVPELQGQTASYARWLLERTDDAFYDHGYFDSMMYYQLAAGLDPRNTKILWGVLAPCLQGSVSRFREALPYAVLVAHLDPQRDEVRYVERRIYLEGVAEQVDRDDEWRTAAGNSTRTGESRSTIRPPLKMVWRSDEAIRPKGGIVVGNGVAICGQWSRASMRSVIHALDLANGSEIWSYSMAGIAMGWPVIGGDNVYIGSSSMAVCLDVMTGHEVWKADDAERPTDGIPVAIIGCPLCIGQMVVFSDEKSRGFDAITGEQIFEVSGSTDPRENVGPCSDGTSLYLPGGRELMRVDLSSFEVAGHCQTNGKVTAGPTLAGGLLVISTNRGTIEALDARTLELVWSFRIEDPELHAIGMNSACAYASGMLFVGALDGNLYALEARTGRRVWKQQIGDSIDASPVVSGDVVFVNAPGKGLCGFNLSTGDILCEERFWNGEFQMGVTGLAVSESLLLAGADNLCAFTSQ